MLHRTSNHKRELKTKNDNVEELTTTHLSHFQCFLNTQWVAANWYCCRVMGPLQSSDKEATRLLCGWRQGESDVGTKGFVDAVSFCSFVLRTADDDVKVSSTCKDLWLSVRVMNILKYCVLALSVAKWRQLILSLLLHSVFSHADRFPTFPKNGPFIPQGLLPWARTKSVDYASQQHKQWSSFVILCPFARSA